MNKLTVVLLNAVMMLATILGILVFGNIFVYHKVDNMLDDNTYMNHMIQRIAERNRPGTMPTTSLSPPIVGVDPRHYNTAAPDLHATWMQDWETQRHQ